MPDSAQERKTGISPLACRTQNEVASCQATVSEARRFGNVLDRSIVVSQTAYMKTFPLFLVLLCLIIIGPKAKAVSPPPDATGTYNKAVAWFSLQSNLTGNFNTAIGAETLFANTADNNTATGTGALFGNATGANNTATGYQALLNNTTANSNIATGFQALQSNSTGGNNTAIGFNALLSKASQLSIRVVERNDAFDVARRIENPNLT
jgi:hypothetical protein